jgi:uncharacterized protein
MLKKLTLFFFLLLGAVGVFAQEVADKDIPARPNTLVNDYAGVLNPDSRQMLERKLDDYNDSTSTQIAIVLVHSIGQYDIDSYGTALGRKWAIGQKGKNNGLLILAAIDDRKVTIQTGYGMEGSIPDAITNQIINEDIKPHFRQQDYYGGLDQATSDIIKYARGEYKGNPQHHKNGGGSGAGIIIVVIIIFILIIIFRNRGGGGHIIDGRGGASPFWWFIAGDMLGSSGRGGGGGGWGGFSGGGDSGGGGGFGGFGGGSFGGGGSSGSW